MARGEEREIITLHRNKKVLLKRLLPYGHVFATAANVNDVTVVLVKIRA